MRSLVFCCLALMLATVVANGQVAADQEREAICKKVVCREATKVKLKVNDKEYAEFEFPKGPYVADGFINVLSGEHFSVEFDEQDGVLSNPRFVKEVVHPERTVSVELSESPTEAGSILKLSNPFSKTIVYECLIQHYKQPNLSSTSVLPVHAHLSTYEGWPYPIPQVVISRVRFESGGYGPGLGNARLDTKARILSKPEPESPKGVATDSAITIVLEAIFTSDATVTNIHFVRVEPRDAPKETVKLFTQKAIDAAKQIKFTPATKDGHQVSMRMQLEYNFAPSANEEKPSNPESPKAKDSKPKV
jgi:hypothetical protein